jgi:hypothetical protein
MLEKMGGEKRGLDRHRMRDLVMWLRALDGCGLNGRRVLSMLVPAIGSSSPLVGSLAIIAALWSCTLSTTVVHGVWVQ